MEQHKLTAHVGGAVHSSETEDVRLDTPIFPDNGHPATPEYQHMIDEHYETIRTNTVKKNNWKKINKRLPFYIYGFSFLEKRHETGMA